MSSDSNQRVVAGTIVGHQHELKFVEKKRSLTSIEGEAKFVESVESRFLRSAFALADIWSKDPSSKVCAIAVGEFKNQVAWGYNGFPPGIADTEERLNDRDLKYKYVIHAEENAMMNAWFRVHELYVTHHPCGQCAPRIAAKRTVKRIVYAKNEEYEDRYKDSIAFAKEVCLEAKIQLVEIKIDLR